MRRKPMIQKAILKTRHLALGAVVAALPSLLSGCGSSDARDTTFVWNLASDPPDHSRPAYAPAVRGPTYAPYEHGSAYVPPGRVDVHPLDQPSDSSGNNTTSSNRYQQSNVRDGHGSMQTAAAELTGTEFAWPLRGRVISEFGAKLSGERNDGINIAASLGSPIHAAANGTVTYAGNGLKGYGNLVLIRHGDGYVTAYAHADTLTVTKGDIVSQGQVIGYAGDSGGAKEPQLHFEIRHGTTPVNPRSLLAGERA